MIDEQSSASEHDCASDRSAIGDEYQHCGTLTDPMLTVQHLVDRNLRETHSKRPPWLGASTIAVGRMVQTGDMSGTGCLA